MDKVKSNHNLHNHRSPTENPNIKAYQPLQRFDSRTFGQGYQNPKDGSEEDHALGLVTDNGLEVLVHIGLDTVSLEGKPFDVKVTEGQTVAAGDLLVEANLDAIREAGRETSTVVVFTNVDAIKSVKVEHTGKLAANAPVAKVEL